MVETLSIAIFGSLTLLFAIGMTAARDGEMDRRANQPVESIPVPETVLHVSAQWAPSFEE